MVKTVTACLLTVFLAGCAGRDANPVRVVNDTDESLSCEALATEMQVNHERAESLVGDQDAELGYNVAIGIVGGLLFWPALFALDLDDAEEVELKALRDRNEYLGGISERKCGT